MAAHSQKTRFAIIFSDLMMGAMGVIIVLLVLLKVVHVRGMGEETASTTVALPPGLIETTSMPLGRMRIVVCGEENAALKLQSNATPSFYSMQLDNQCELRIYVFREGFSFVYLFMAEAVETPLNIAYTLTIGGILYENKTVQLSQAPANNVIFDLVL